MKFRVTMKDPDGVGDGIQDAARQMVAKIEGVDDDERDSLIESKQEKLSELASTWFEYGEYLTVEIDTEAKSISVLPR